jgi:hypothetical protein
MTRIKMFIIGALVWTLFGATFLGAISHLLVIALAVVGAGAVALESRRRAPGRRSRKGLNASPKPDA